MMGRIIIVLAIQTVALAVMVGNKQYTLNTGAQILLETMPVDPRSLFRGDYVRLNYTISTLDLDELEGEDQFNRHDSVYVTLKQGDIYHEPVAVWHQFPEVEAAQLVIKGEVKYINKQQWNSDLDRYEPVTILSVRYGIENYFVPEGEGLILERQRDGKVDIRVAVDSRGNAGIKAVLVNGAERYVERLF